MLERKKFILLTQMLLKLQNTQGAHVLLNLGNFAPYFAVFETLESLDKDPIVWSGHDEPGTINELPNDLDSFLFCYYDMEISTDDMLYKISRISKFSENHILEQDTKKPMSSQVINTKVGSLNVVQYANCLEPLEAILQKLKRAHDRYGYEYVLDHLEEANRQGCKEFQSQLTIPVLQMFFRNIFQTLIPRALFQSNKNINVVVKIITDLLKVPKFQAISLKSYIKKMRISELRWLKDVDNTEAKWSILGKLLKWFFDKYILAVIRCLFYIILGNGYEKIYFKQSDWKSLTSKFLHKMREEKVIANTRGLSSKISCDGRWTLFPKKKGMRPIMSNIKGNKPGATTKIALCYLQQLYMTKYGESGKLAFFYKWKNLVDQVRNDENKTMYLVCCDIKFAYGSIDQKKLLKIVESLAESTGPEVRLKFYNVARDFRAVKSGCMKIKNCVTYPELEMPIASESIFAHGTDKGIKMSKELLLRVIHQNIRNQNILMSKQKFLLQKGIAQGAILSSVLCDLYYAHMEETVMSEFKDQGFLHRYVDDFLFATKDKALAERFLKHVYDGFPEYNCKFNTTKTKSNLPSCRPRQKNITYLGFEIDSTTLEVTPVYQKSARYSTMLSRPRYNVVKTFQKRLMNLSSLKLDGIILDCKINSQETVIDNMKRIFERQAERCLWLLKALFDDLHIHRSKIYAIMRLANRQIFIRVQRYYLSKGYSFDNLGPHLTILPWLAYRRVFGTQRLIHTTFRHLFLKNIKLCERAKAELFSQDNSRAVIPKATSAIGCNYSFPAAHG